MSYWLNEIKQILALTASNIFTNLMLKTKSKIRAILDWSEQNKFDFFSLLFLNFVGDKKSCLGV